MDGYIHIEGYFKNNLKIVIFFIFFNCYFFEWFDDM